MHHDGCAEAPQNMLLDLCDCLAVERLPLRLVRCQGVKLPCGGAGQSVGRDPSRYLMRRGDLVALGGKGEVARPSRFSGSLPHCERSIRSPRDGHLHDQWHPEAHCVCIYDSALWPGGELKFPSRYCILRLGTTITSRRAIACPRSTRNEKNTEIFVRRFCSLLWAASASSAGTHSKISFGPAGCCQHLPLSWLLACGARHTMYNDDNRSSGPFSSLEECVAGSTQPAFGTMASKMHDGRANVLRDQ